MNILFKLFGVLVLILSLVIGWYWQSLAQFSSAPVGFSGDNKEFVVKAGSSVSAVARQLKRQGIISSASKFIWMIRLDGGTASVQVGEYEILSNMSPREIYSNLSTGKVKQYAFTIVEGWSMKQLLAALSGNRHIKHTLKGKTPKQIMAALGHADVHPEGRFLPDTYYFPSGSTDREFLKRAYESMEAVLKNAWPKRVSNLPYKTPYDALIMASIVEKETGVASEREEIAGVFVQRIRKKMRLQTDPTVIYGMGDKYKGNLRKKDLKKDTPYNTYRRKGLPPTPIAMPGKAAILAALNPKESDNLYFVAKGDGSHYFSATVKEHNKAVRKYQIRNRKADYRSTPDSTKATVQ